MMRKDGNKRLNKKGAGTVNFGEYGTTRCQALLNFYKHMNSL